MRRTGRSELGVNPLSHNPLQPQTQTQERNAHERQYIRPQGVAPVIRDTGFPTLPYCQGGRHGEQCLDECAEHQPCACLRSHFVTYPADEGADCE